MTLSVKCQTKITNQTIIFKIGTVATASTGVAACLIGKGMPMSDVLRVTGDANCL